jgi:hypothetical protein
MTTRKFVIWTLGYAADARRTAVTTDGSLPQLQGCERIAWEVKPTRPSAPVSEAHARAMSSKDNS